MGVHMPTKPASMAVLTGIVALALFLPNLSYDFAWDDHYLVVHNPQIHSLDNAADWFTKPWASGADSERGQSQNALYWRPLTQASYAVDWALGGGSPALFHWTNNLLHALCSGLVTLLLAWLWLPLGLPASRRSSGALIAGLLFALHPVHSEAVHLITYRTTLLATLSVLSGLVLHVRFPRGLWCLVPFALGLMAKEEAIVLPGLLVVMDMALKRFPSSPRAIGLRYAPITLVALAYLFLHSSITQPASLDFFAGQEKDTVVFTMLKVFVLDARLLLWPWPLTSFYDWMIVPYAHHPFHLEVLAGFVLLVGSLVWLYRSYKKGWSSAFFVLGFYLCALTPYSHVLPFFDVAGERFLYLPSVAFCCGVALFLTRYSLRVERALFGAVALVFGSLVMITSPHYETTRTLLHSAQEAYPQSYFAPYELGRLELKEKQYAEAEKYLKAAYENLPLEVAGLCYAESLRLQGKEDEAVEFLKSEVSNSARKRPAFEYTLSQRVGTGPSTPIQCDLGTMLESKR